MNEQTIKQHYISRCILINFSNHKEQVYECLLGKKSIYLANIYDSMMEKFTYEHPYFENNSIENWFAEKIEPGVTPAIEEILSLIDNPNIANVNLGSIKNVINKQLYNFLVFYYRSGALLYEYSFGKKDKDDRILLMAEKLMNSEYLRALSNSIIKYYDFAIIKSVHGRFLLSDQFLSTVALSIKNKFYQISNRHIGLKDTIIFIPISKNYYALFYNGNIPKYILRNKINTLDDSQVSEINGIIINNSYRKCISYSKEAIEAAIGKYEYASPSNIYASSSNNFSFGATLKKEVFFYSKDRKAWELMSMPHKWSKYDNVNRNDICPCGSNKKYKKCCLEALDIAKSIIGPFAATQSYPFANINMEKDAISIDATIEIPIEEFVRN